MIDPSTYQRNPINGDPYTKSNQQRSQIVNYFNPNSQIGNLSRSVDIDTNKIRHSSIGYRPQIYTFQSVNQPLSSGVYSSPKNPVFFQANQSTSTPQKAHQLNFLSSSIPKFSNSVATLPIGNLHLSKIDQPQTYTNNINSDSKRATISAEESANFQKILDSKKLPKYQGYNLKRNVRSMN